MDILFILSMLCAGLIIGSFLNVCIYRIPKEESINYPPSHCQSCQHQLGVWDLIPVISYLFLRGKCRYCGSKVSRQYPLIELANGLLYVLAYMHFGLSLQTLMVCGFVSVVIVLTMIDAREMILPTKIIVFGSLWAIGCRSLMAYLAKDFNVLLEGLLAGLIGYGFIASIFWLSLKLMKREGMGYGDVRYLGMIGLFTSPLDIGITLFISCIIGAVYGLILYYKNGRESVAFPFGPFLSIGAMITLFYGEQLWHAYLAWCIK